MKACAAIAMAGALAAVALPVSAQPAPRWPSMCVCKSSDPNAFTTHYMALATDGRDFGALEARLAEMDYRPVGRTVAIPSVCPIAKVCTDEDKLPVDDADLKVKILGYVADTGLVVDDRVQPDKFVRGVTLILSGRAE